MQLVNFETVKATLDLTQESLYHSIKAFPWENADAYAQWLASTYFYANKSTRIIAIGAGTMPMQHTAISDRFIQHAAEEKGHEKLLINDLKAFNLDIQNVQVPNMMKAYFRTLYHWISPHGNPVGLFGWILSLEALAAKQGSWVLEQVKKCHGKGYSFLKVHSDADPDHLDKAILAVKNLAPEELAIVNDALKMYSELYVEMLKKISTDLQRVKEAS